MTKLGNIKFSEILPKLPKGLTPEHLLSKEDAAIENDLQEQHCKAFFVKLCLIQKTAQVVTY